MVLFFDRFFTRIGEGAFGGKPRVTFPHDISPLSTFWSQTQKPRARHQALFFCPGGVLGSQGTNLGEIGPWR